MILPISLKISIITGRMGEKMQKLKSTNSLTYKDVTVKWSDLIAIDQIKNDWLCKITKLNHATLYPSYFETFFNLKKYVLDV